MFFSLRYTSFMLKSSSTKPRRRRRFVIELKGKNPKGHTLHFVIISQRWVFCQHFSKKIFLQRAANARRS